jgi:hypothetical protein
MPGPVVYAAVEGKVDEAVVRKLIDHAGGSAGDVHVKQGKRNLKKRIPAYIQAAHYYRWLVLVDLDKEQCAPKLKDAWIPQMPPAQFCFRVAVREVEAWLLADVEKIAEFLGVRRSKIPEQPETLEDPKAYLLELAQASKKRDIRQDMVPRSGSGIKEGPAYSSRMIEFTHSYWRPDFAAKRADSLRRAIKSLRSLM